MKRLTANWPALPSASSAGGEALQLQWADYLEERGEGEWAELIRLQLALNRLGAMAASVRPEWLEREAELRALLAQRWQAELGELLVGPLQFRGGIPDTVAVAAPVFIDRAAELFARLPLRRVRLLDVAGCWNKLWQCPWLARLQELDLCATDLAQLDLTPLWRSPHLRALRGLDLSFNQLTNDLLRPLQRHCPFPQLRRLALNDNRLTGQVFELLGSSACVSTLEEVDLSHNEITAEGLAEVAVHPWPRLHLLRLSGNPLGDAGVALLATSPLLAQMVGQHGRLELRGHAQVRISAAGATALAHSPVAAAVTLLDLSDQDLGDSGLVALLPEGSWPRLRHLHLARNRITDRGIRRLRRRWTHWLAQLHTLDVSGNQLTAFGLALLQAARPPESELALDTSGNLQNLPTDASPQPSAGQISCCSAVPSDVKALMQRIAHPRRNRS